MSLPTYPTDAVAFLASLNSGTYNEVTNPGGMGGDGAIVNWPEAMASISIVTSYDAALGAALLLLASQVAADAASAAAGSGTETTAADIRVGSAATYVSPRRIYAANVFVTLTDAASIAWNMSLGINFKVTLGAAGRALANPSATIDGKSGLLQFIQDGTGGRTITTWGSNLVWYGGEPAWPTTPGARTLASYFVDGTTLILQAGGSNAA